jgi:hypothetical protein
LVRAVMLSTFKLTEAKIVKNNNKTNNKNEKKSAMTTQSILYW